MKTINGNPICGKVAIGKCFCYTKDNRTVKRYSVDSTDDEIIRFENAKREAYEQLMDLYRRSVNEIGKINASVFETHAMLIRDPDFCDAVVSMIERQKVNAEYAVAKAGDNYAELFAGMDDDYFSTKSDDIRDVAERVITILLGDKPVFQGIEEPVIIFAEELSPSELAQIGRDYILGIVIRNASDHSHTAIIAKSMNIPVLSGIGMQPEWNEKTAIIDGHEGMLVIEPDEPTMNFYVKKKDNETKEMELLKELKGKPNVTMSGRSIEIYANIGGEQDLSAVIGNDAGGIGLFRSEFLYIGRDDYPSEEEQFSVYRKVAETLGGRPVVIRTADLGADKNGKYMDTNTGEANPALGYRGIRVSLDRPSTFRTQIRAIIRASAYGDIRIMYPMISSDVEVEKCKLIYEEALNELDSMGIEHGDVQQGIMIETPAAALMSNKLAEMVDFFSIGTNDLTQFTLAVDRLNASLDTYYNPYHEAVLSLIDMTIKNAHSHNIKVGICGELGSDVNMIRRLIDMDVDSLSMPPSKILPIRKTIRELQ